MIGIIFAQCDKKMKMSSSNNQSKLPPRNQTYLAIARLAFQKCFCPIILTTLSGDMSISDTYSTMEVSDSSSLWAISPVCDDLQVLSSWESVSLIRLLILPALLMISHSNGKKITIIDIYDRSGKDSAINLTIRSEFQLYYIGLM